MSTLAVEFDLVFREVMLAFLEFQGHVKKTTRRLDKRETLTIFMITQNKRIKLSTPLVLTMQGG
jgi:hypothetical protein